MKKLLHLTLSACLFLQLSYGQQSANYSVLFKSGAVVPVENIESFKAQGRLQSLPLFEGKYYCLIQFNAIPDNLKKQALQNSGINLLSYIPHNAWIASIDAGADVSLFSGLNIRSIQQLTNQQKLNEELNAAYLPGWAIKQAGTIDLIVQYFKDADAEKVEAALRNSGCEILLYGKNLSAYTVRVNSKNGVMLLAGLPFVQFIQPVAPPPTPDDTKGRSLHRSNVINSDYASGLHYDGTGVTVAIADDGSISHIDFKGRLTDLTEQGQATNHGDMTSGICVGAGNLNPVIRGMGTGAHLVLFDIFGSSLGDYPQIVNAVSNYTNYDVAIVSTSYSQGCNVYNAYSQEGDQILHNNRQLMFCFSAGNNHPADCGYGAGTEWGNVTGGYKQGKNVTTCANVDASGIIDASSSLGPASDGRIKPDIAANGKDQLSTDQNNGYQVGGGTSAASPGVAGCYSQLYQAYKSMNGGNNPEGALIKACILNTANEIGNPGPDYKFGWGQINARRAYETLANQNYLSDSVLQGGSNTHTITVPANALGFKVMLYWNDVEGDPTASKALVNNLDLTLADPGSNVLLPLVLDPTPNTTTLGLPAVPGVDTLNNMEQVTVNSPAPGTYTVTVTGTEVPMGPQDYYLVWEYRGNEITVTYPNGGEGFVPGEQELIRWDAEGNAGTFMVEYSLDNGGTWFTATASIPGNLRQYTWTVPAVVSGKVLIRVSNSGVSDENDFPFSIIKTPQNITVDYACPDSLRLIWDSVPNAIAYRIYMLGAMYMDSIGTSPTTDFTVGGINPVDEFWFSVSAITPDTTPGRRALAIQKQPGTFNCPLSLDVKLKTLLAPSGTLPDCEDNSAVTVSIAIENRGMDTVTTIPVAYSLNGAAPVTETWTGILPPFATAVFDFTAKANLTALGNYSLAVWTDYPGDLDNYNDTARTNIAVIAGTLVSLPYLEDFQTFTLCGTANNCEATICPLANGMINEINGVQDDIDWRTNSGGTPSTGTGPTADHTTGTAAGKYLYTEASVCFIKTAVMITPCIDLNGAPAPQLTFWYHMYGAAMGTLHVDVLADAKWNNDLSIISGDQGNIWTKDTIDLLSFAGKIITVRFRGETGSDYTSDIAVDDINIPGPTGIEESYSDGYMSITPNPSQGKFLIKMNNMKDKAAILNVTDTKGRIIKTLPLDLTTVHNFPIDLSSCSRGVYFVEIRSGDKVFYAKVVIL